jgi:hypothetical protein
MIISSTLIPRCFECGEKMWQWKFLTVGGLPIHWRHLIGFRPFEESR